VVVDGGIADATVAEDSAFNLDLSTRFSDADGESLTFSAAGLPSWLTLENGVLSGTPSDSDVAGPVTVTVTAKDAAGAEVSDSFTLTVTNTNDAPTVAEEAADQTGKVGQALSLALPATMFADADLDSGDTLTLSAAGLPEGVSFDPATRTFSGAPTAAGTYDVTVTATDSAGEAVSDTFALVV
ncbi:putative Ig domain-containing protein, partial [Microvirga sp. GCM10011540]|uniref:putative Ig domain-containing protein n=1 Tax=Microvirga sp. GCM10011540 TaxID=3317338 RepID=UPI00361F4B9D